MFFSCIIISQLRRPIEFKFSQVCYFVHNVRRHVFDIKGVHQRCAVPLILPSNRVDRLFVVIWFDFFSVLNYQHESTIHNGKWLFPWDPIPGVAHNGVVVANKPWKKQPVMAGHWPSRVTLGQQQGFSTRKAFECARRDPVARLDLVRWMTVFNCLWRS